MNRIPRIDNLSGEVQFITDLMFTTSDVDIIHGISYMSMFLFHHKLMSVNESEVGYLYRPLYLNQS